MSGVQLGVPAGLPAMLRFSPGEFAVAVDGLTVETPGDVAIRVLDEVGTELCRVNPLRVAAEHRRRHYATTGNRALLDVEATLASSPVFLRDPAAGLSKTQNSLRLLMGDIARVGDEEA